MSSESAEEITVDPEETQAIDDRFRIGGPWTDVISAFIGAVSTSRFPPVTPAQGTTDVIDTCATRIEWQLLNLLDEQQDSQMISPSSFIDTEFEESGNCAGNSYQ